uniref:ATPase AAA-type core domain-containing protein n=1 Tax=viral metagenome TaxID=1070528 RepID=A0A6C0DC19_9ZZZZ
MILAVLYTIILSSISILWTLIIVPFLLFGYSFYCITENNLITTITKKIKYSTMRDEQDDPSGFFVGKYYIGYILTATTEKTTKTLYCLCTRSQFDKLKYKQDEVVKETDIFIDLYVRKGNYWNFMYKQRRLNCTRFIPKPNQQNIIEQVIPFYKDNNRCVIMISGNPGTGKSIMGILIAKEMNGVLCKTYNPTTPGDNLENIYNQVNPTINTPLILLIDEFDILIETFHNKQAKIHDHIPTEVYNKTTYNNLFDDINLTLYPNVVVILTTNLTKEMIEEKYDSSYIREGRVDMIFNL